MGGPPIEPKEPGERVRRGTTAEQIRGPEPQPPAGAVTVPPADALPEPLRATFSGLEPGKVYLIAYDKHHVNMADAMLLAHWLDKQGVKVVMLRTNGDPTKAVVITPAEELAK